VGEQKREKKVTNDPYERVIARQCTYCPCCDRQETFLLVQNDFPVIMSFFWLSKISFSTYLVCSCCGGVLPIMAIKELQ